MSLKVPDRKPENEPLCQGLVVAHREVLQCVCGEVAGLAEDEFNPPVADCPDPGALRQVEMVKALK